MELTRYFLNFPFKQKQNTCKIPWKIFAHSNITPQQQIGAQIDNAVMCNLFYWIC